jgi:hypothetical protein
MPTLRLAGGPDALPRAVATSATAAVSAESATRSSPIAVGLCVVGEVREAGVQRARQQRVLAMRAAVVPRQAPSRRRGTEQSCDLDRAAVNAWRRPRARLVEQRGFGRLSVGRHVRLRTYGATQLRSVRT